MVGPHVALIEIRRPPHNYFDPELIGALATVTDELGADGGTRAVVLASQGKHFCAGADFAGSSGAAPVSADEGARTLYAAAVRFLGGPLPVIAAVQGAAIGGGLGLAVAADFRVAGPSSSFAANFSRLGLHHGFGLTTTLPRVVGHQYAHDLLLTGRRVNGSEAYRMGLVDRLVDDDAIRTAAIEFASEIAACAPLAVRGIRATMRGDLVRAVEQATDHERAEQARLRETADFAEGVAAAAERRTPAFTAR